MDTTSYVLIDGNVFMVTTIDDDMTDGYADDYLLAS